jgi:branched-chain amino acid transport system substrate-binding protein
LRPQKAIETFVKIQKTTTDETLRSKATMSIFSSIDKMSINELKDLEGSYEEWRPYVVFKLGEKYMQQGDVGAAKDKFRGYINDYPLHEYVVQAQNYINRMDSLEKVDPNTIGVILPLTGRNAPFGLKSLMGVQLATGVFGDGKNSRSGIKLAVMDSQDDPEVARIAVDRLIEEDNVIAIVGPLGGDAAEVVARQCALAGIPNITLSQKEDLEGLGKYVFRIAMTNRNQIKRLVSYAMDDLSMTRFGILYPSDSYGQELSKYFWDEVLSRGGDITVVQPYKVRQDDFRDDVRKILGNYYTWARKTEYNDIKKQIEDEAAASTSKKKKDKEVRLPPIISFDALFIPDDARTAAQIAPYLPYYDARDVVLLGPNTWNSPQLVARGGGNVEGAIFVDGFSNSPDFEEGKTFIKNFKSAFNSAPGVLEAQAYDATNVLINAIKKGSETRDSLRSAIPGTGTFTGATGKISFENNGETEKELFVMGIERGKIVLKE